VRSRSASPTPWAGPPPRVPWTTGCTTRPTPRSSRTRRCRSACSRPTPTGTNQPLALWYPTHSELQGSFLRYRTDPKRQYRILAPTAPNAPSGEGPRPILSIFLWVRAQLPTALVLTASVAGLSSQLPQDGGDVPGGERSRLLGRPGGEAGASA
jgi:hypothetical protein